MPARPLITCILYAFNEESYIEDAIASIFAQTYSPLEIILSDDGSTDRTPEIMEQMALKYCGSHKVMLNLNTRNIGIGSQINAALQKSEGELIVLANGDDISLPHRVERIVDAWEASGRQAAAISSAYEVIMANGERTGRVVSARADFSDLAASTARRFGGPVAAVGSVSRRCFERFGALASNLILEDGPMNLRSSITGSWYFIDEPLVLYRVHAENISQAYLSSDFKTWRSRHRSKARWQMREGEKAFVQMLVDLYSEGVSDQDQKVIAQARVNAARQLLQYQLRASYYCDEWCFGIPAWLSFGLELLSSTLKIALKKAFPVIERRNDRWHYRCMMQVSQQAESSQ